MKIVQFDGPQFPDDRGEFRHTKFVERLGVYVGEYYGALNLTEYTGTWPVPEKEFKCFDSPIAFLDALPDAVQDEFFTLLNNGQADAAKAQQWLERAKMRGFVDFNEIKNRNGMTWLVAKTSLTQSEADALMAA